MADMEDFSYRQPMTRRCRVGDHAVCPGSWTRYPDADGPCECQCHADLPRAEHTFRPGQPGLLAPTLLDVSAVA